MAVARNSTPRLLDRHCRKDRNKNGRLEKKKESKEILGTAMGCGLACFDRWDACNECIDCHSFV